MSRLRLITNTQSHRSSRPASCGSSRLFRHYSFPRLPRRTRLWLAPYLEALPALALVVLFAVGTLNGVAQGFGIMPFLGRTTPTLQYLVQALQREDFLAALRFSLSTSALAATIALVGGVVLAQALLSGGFGKRAQLVCLQLPLMSMHALVALAFVFMLGGSGLFARLLFAWGVIGGPQDVPSMVGAPSGWGIVVVYVWKELPYLAFVTLSALKHIAGRLGQAAATCGATRLQTFVHITLPLVLPAALRAYLVVLVFALGSYEVPFLLGPTAPKALPVLAYFEFTKPDLANRSYAMALDTLMLGVCLIAALFYIVLLLVERRNRGEAYPAR